MQTTLIKRSQIFTIPNLLSLFRLCLIPVIVWLYCEKEADVSAGMVLILSGLTDMLDGFLARHFHWVSDLGKILDPVADKLTQAAMLICLVLRNSMILLPLCLMILKELFMAVSGFLVIHRTGTVKSARWHGKVATCLLYGMMILHVFWRDLPLIYSDLSIFLCSAMIALSFILYGLDNIRTLNQLRKAHHEA